MENTTITTEKAIELINTQIKDYQWHIDYHEQKLAEYRLKMQLAESMLELYSNPDPDSFGL